MVNPRTGRIHSSFNQALAATGRLSSNNPNLQNIPVRTPEGAKVREAFIPQDQDLPPAGGRLLPDRAPPDRRDQRRRGHAGGFSVRAGYPPGHCRRQGIRRAVRRGEQGQRYRAKTVNFSIIYDAGAQNLSRQLEINRSEAKDLIDNYFKQYKGLRAYMDKTVEDARRRVS